jgi:hypothetical protein
MDREMLMPIALVAAAALLLGPLALLILPSDVIGLPTPLVVLGGMSGSILAAVRWL